MSSKILAYCKCSAASAPEMIKIFETNYNCKYSWGESYNYIKNAKLVAVKEVNGHKYVITHSNYKYFLEYYGLTTSILGEL